MPEQEEHESALALAHRISDAYGLVLFLVATTFVVTMTLPPTGWGGRVGAVAVISVTAIVALTSSNVSRRRVWIACAFALLAIGSTALARALDSDALLGFAFLVAAGLMSVATFTILRRVIFSADVDFRTIMGAISVFAMLGLLFGYLFLALGRLKGGVVFQGVPQARDYIFFSYTTLTTTGYGNLVPAGTVGQSLAVIEMVVGQVFMVTLVAGLVSLWRPGGRQDQPSSEPAVEGPGAATR
jgi:hypothetical protein